MYEIIGSSLISLIVALWVFFDARKRDDDQALWFLRSFFLTIFVVPNYFAKRNLEEGESRKGGTSWNVLKNFALIWSLVMVYVLFFSNISALNVVGSTINDPLGLFGLAMLWGIPVFGALFLGIMLRDPTQIEKGPTSR